MEPSKNLVVVDQPFVQKDRIFFFNSKNKFSYYFEWWVMEATIPQSNGRIFATIRPREKIRLCMRPQSNLYVIHTMFLIDVF
jgi:hypothetical protein